MTEAEQVMKRCQIGTRNYDEANNLHADCYRVIGKLLAEKSMREVQRLGQEIEQNSMSDEMLQAITDPENQPSQYGTVTLDYHFEKIKKWEDLFERMSNKVLQQLEQEPVAWMWRCKSYCDWPNWGVSLKRPADSGCYGDKRTEGYEDVPLYATPPQRTERHELQAKGEHPAPCARHCEANAFQIVIKNLKAQLAQPEQEPVIDKSAAVRIATSLGWTPQRKPLTDEEIMDACDSTGWIAPQGVAIDLARAIEAAHGIKENT